MKILLLNPPFKSEFGRFSREQRSPAITKGGTFYFPMWLCYATGVLEQKGFEVLLVDAPASRMKDTLVFAQAKAFMPDIAVINTSTPSLFNDINIAEHIKEITKAFTILVGTHPTAEPESTLSISDKVDAVARREYEYTLLDLSEKLKASGSRVDKNLLQSIDGISFRWDNEIFHNSDRSPVEDLDALPFLSSIYKKHLNVRDYFYTIAQHPQVAIFSGRGCPHRCVYCVYPQVMHGHRYRMRSVENLIAEFQYIERELPWVREIFIEDDSFTVNRDRVTRFCENYLSAGLRISWIANSRADIDYETLKILKKSNCRLLCVGFESGDQNVLDSMGKRLKVEDAIDFVKNASHVGILIHGCFIVGNPGETQGTLEKTLELARSLRLDTAQFFPIIVYPGTTAYSWAKDNGYLLSEDFSQWNSEDGSYNCLITRPGLKNDDLVEFCDKARRAFYLRPKYLLYRLKRLLTHPIQDGPRMLKSLKIFAKNL